MAHDRALIAGRRGTARAGTPSTPWLAGLRWVPVPLAILMAILGWLVFGSVLGQHALASAHAGPEQGGMGLTVNQVVWMADDMSTPGTKANPAAFSMPSSEMPGMQTVGEKRLRIELYLRNISNSQQRYALAEFRLLGTGGKSWPPLDNAAVRGQVLSAVLDPDFQTTVDVYFDLPASQRGRLWLEWEHGGHIMAIPLHIGPAMVGM